MGIIGVLLALSGLSSLTQCISGAAAVTIQGPPVPASLNTLGPQFVNSSAVLKDYFAQTFLKQNIPFIDIPDKLIQDVYYYRWYSLTHHLSYATQGAGYAITEFVLSVGYGGAYNTINAHHHTL